MPKALRFWGSSQEDLRAFPRDAKREAGHQLRQIQNGSEAAHWRPMKTVAPGVREIKITGEDGQYRVFYIAAFASAVYVLHAFQKTTRQTAKRDIELAKRRYSEVKAHERQAKVH